MHVALGYQYPSHMLLLLLVAAFCHLRLPLKETTPPAPPLPPPQTKANKHKNYKSIIAKKQSSCWRFGGGWGRGGVCVGKYSLWRFSCKIMWFFFSIYLLQSATTTTKPSEAPSKYKFFYFIKRQKPASDFWKKEVGCYKSLNLKNQFEQAIL